MIYKVLLLSFVLVSFGTAYASNAEVDLSGLNAHADQDLLGTSNFKGAVGFDSSSFFYKSDVHGTASTTVQAILDGKSDSRTLHSEGNLQLYTFLNNKPEFGFESREMYLQTQKGLITDSEISVGRKVYEWSKLDKTWTMMSLWSPRWTWDELHPEIIGMTGAFFHHKGRNFELTAFGSPIAIPERGTPISEKDGNLVSPNPFWKPLPSQLTLTPNAPPVDVHYSLITPPMKDILLRPNFALHGRYDFESGAWLSLNTGVLPVNMTQLAAEPYAAVGNTSAAFQVNIRPEFPMRNINTAEAGFVGENKAWDVWSSISYEQPFNFVNQSNWLNPIITPSTIISAGSNVQLTSNFRFEGAVLYINEQHFDNPSTLKSVSVNLPTRFPLKQGIKVGGNWKFSELNESNFSWVQDLLESNHFVSADLEHHFHTSPVTVGTGADVIVAGSNKGWVGQYYGDSRLRGWLKYVF